MSDLFQPAHVASLWRMTTAAADILLVAYVIYRVLLLIRGTRAVSVLGGLFLLLAIHLVARWIGLATFDWLVGSFLTYGLAFGLVVVFQDEIRRGLARLGSNRILGRFDRATGRDTVDEVAGAAEAMAARRVGALIVIERIADLADYAQTGIPVDARVSKELLETVFHPGSALHDGAAIVRSGRLVAARCMLPRSSQQSDRQLGTRHLAALGLSEEVDAPVVVVSEERGEIALAIGGRLHRPLDGASLRRFLHRLYAPPPRPAPGFWRSWLRFGGGGGSPAVERPSERPDAGAAEIGPTERAAPSAEV